jgi:hypothetical protein
MNNNGNLDIVNLLTALARSQGKTYLPMIDFYVPPFVLC